MNGVPLRELDEPEGLREWVGALRLLRCCERYTEAPCLKDLTVTVRFHLLLRGFLVRLSQGQHRSIKQVMVRAPHASESYISTELRQQTINRLLGDPKASHGVCVVWYMWSCAIFDCRYYLRLRSDMPISAKRRA